MIKKLLAGLALAAVTISPAVVRNACAADYPTRPITVIVPFGAGGDTDVIGRLLATEMSKILGQNVAVQNVVGANGLNGMNAVATAKPDGYTLGFCPPAPLVVHPYLRQLPYSIDSFSVIGRAYNAPCFLVVPKNSPWNSVDDMLTAIKNEPGSFFWASSGIGSIPHLATLAFFQKYGINPANHIGFNGDADAFQALAGNRAQLYTSTAINIGSYDIKPLVLLGEERHPSFPDIPTARELGQDVTIGLFGTLIAPKNTPAEIIGTLSAAMKQACEAKAFTDALAKLGMEPAWLNPEDTLTFLQQQIARNKNLLQELSQKN